MAIDGYGYGSGSGSGYGYGYGYGYGEININKKNAWLAWHYIRKSGDNEYVARNGMLISISDELTESEIAMCEKGLHASLLPTDARQYAPSNSVLTKVKIWGRVIVGKDKLVATHRQLIMECNKRQ